MLNKTTLRFNEKMVLAVAHQLLTAVYGLGLLLFLYRTISKEEIGRWLLFSAGVSIADMLMHGFLQTPIIRKLTTQKKSGTSINTVASTAFIFSAMIWLCVSLLILLTSSLIGKSQLLQDLRWYWAMGLFMALYNVSWWIGSALSDFKSVFVQRLIFCLTSWAVMLVFLISYERLNIHNIIISQIAGYALSSIVAMIWIRKIRIAPGLFSKNCASYFMSYGKFTSGSMIMGSLLRNADVFMIAAFLNESAVAVYSTAQKTVEIFEVALRGIASHALPEFCRCAGDFNLLMKKYLRATSLLLLFLVPLALIMAFFSEKVIRILSGSVSYNEASIVLRIFMAYILFLVVDRMTGVTLEAMGLPRFNLIKTVLLVLVNIIGNAIALYYFKSLAGVAAVSILAAITGIVSGAYFIIVNSGLVVKRHHFRTGINLVLR